MKQSQLRSNSAQTSGDSVNAPLLDSTTSVFSDDDEDATSPNKNSKNDSAATCVKFFINLLSIPSKAANALNFEGLNSSPNSNPFHSRYGGTENENRWERFASPSHPHPTNPAQQQILASLHNSPFDIFHGLRIHAHSMLFQRLSRRFWPVPHIDWRDCADLSADHHCLHSVDENSAGA